MASAKKRKTKKRVACPLIERDRRLSKRLAFGYAKPTRIRADTRRVYWPRHLSWEVFRATLGHFIERTLRETPGHDTQRRLREFLAMLHLRASMLPEALARQLGVLEERAALLRAIEAAFPALPLVGRPLGEAVLDDERAFREVTTAETDVARSQAEVHDWRRISDAELGQAFAQNSVCPWLDGSSWPFYLPAFLSHALRNPASRCEGSTRQTVVALLARTATYPTDDAQLEVLRAFLRFVAADVPWFRWAGEHADVLSKH